MPDGVTFVRDAVLRPSVDPAAADDRAAMAGRRAYASAPTVHRERRHRRLHGDRHKQWPTSSLTFGNECAIPRINWDCPRSGAGGRGSSRRWFRRRRARRCKRRMLRPVLAFAQDVAVLWVPRTSDGALAYAASAHIPLTGDPAFVQQAGRAVIDDVAKGRARRGVPRLAKVVVALPAGQVLRKEMRLPGGGRAGSEAGACLRSRSPHAVQARRASLRRRRRRPRREERRDSRRLGGGVAQRGYRSAATRGELGGDGRRRHAGRTGSRGSCRLRRLAAQPVSRSRASGRSPGGAAGGSGCRSLWSHSSRSSRSCCRYGKSGAMSSRCSRPPLQARVQADAASGLRPAARNDDGRLQLRARQEIRIPEPGAGAGRRDEAPPRRHLDHAARGEERAAGQGAAPRAPAARRERERRPPRFAARGIEGLRGGRAAFADDQDPARSRRDIRSWRAARAHAAAAAVAAHELGRRAGCGRADCRACSRTRRLPAPAPLRAPTPAGGAPASAAIPLCGAVRPRRHCEARYRRLTAFGPPPPAGSAAGNDGATGYAATARDRSPRRRPMLRRPPSWTDNR